MEGRVDKYTKWWVGKQGSPAFKVGHDLALRQQPRLSAPFNKLFPPDVQMWRVGLSADSKARSVVSRSILWKARDLRPVRCAADHVPRAVVDTTLSNVYVGTAQMRKIEDVRGHLLV